MPAIIDSNAFDVDNIRHAKARDGDLQGLRKSYANDAYPELPDMSSAELWDDLAGSREIPDFRIRRLRAVADQVPPGSNVLDVGIGWGEIIPMILERNNCRYTGIDFSAKIVAAAAKAHPACKFMVGSLADVADQFDVVLALEVCEHILPSRIFDFFGHIKRLLAADGLLIITVPVYENLRAMTLRCPHCGHMHNRMGHVRAYTPELIAAELKLAGFNVCDSFFIYASFGNSPAGWIKRRIVDLGRYLLKLGKTSPLNVVVVARNSADR